MQTKLISGHFFPKPLSYLLSFLTGLILLSSCSNWAIKDQCKGTNWFEYAQGVSFSGKYLEEDHFVKQCKELDLINAQHLDQGFKLGRDKGCSYDEIFKRGKAGTPVNFKFCDGLEPQLMTKKHRDGLAFFCTADNGYPFGKSGQSYQKVCSAEQEKVFLPTYHSGRKQFLTERKDSLNSQISQIEFSIGNLSQREQNSSRDYHSLPSVHQCFTKTVYNEALKRDESKQICEEASYIRMQRDGLYSQLESIRGELRSQNAKLREQRKELEEVNLELNKIP